MMQWMTLFQKEVVENWRNFKWVWVPLVFILIAIMDPLTMYYMPVILESGAGVPDGAIFEMPTPSTTELLMMSLSQLNTIGIVVVVLMAMGTIANERKSGVLELTLVKPISYSKYITAKWLSLVCLIAVSLFAALSVHWYYVNLLFDPISYTEILLVGLFFGSWFLFVAALIILYNTFAPSAGVVAALSIGTIIVLSVATSTFSKYLTWSPANIPELIQELVHTSSIPFDLIMALGVTWILTVACLWISVLCMERKEVS